jgi:hypothetical protein
VYDLWHSHLLRDNESIVHCTIAVDVSVQGAGAIFTINLPENSTKGAASLGKMHPMTLVDI